MDIKKPKVKIAGKNNTKSKHTGIWITEYNKYQVRLKILEKNIHVGVYNNLNIALSARLIAIATKEFYINYYNEKINNRLVENKKILDKINNEEDLLLHKNKIITEKVIEKIKNNIDFLTEINKKITK